MLEALVKSVIGVSAILFGWLTVQMMWRRLTGASPGEDPLAGRLGCHGCGCHDRCQDADEDGVGKQNNEHGQEDLVRT